MPPDRHETQPSAEIVRVGCAKRRRDCDLSRSRATLCGDRARRVREMQARLRFVPVAGNPLWRLCMSSARNAGETAICPGRGQPSAGIVRVECAKCRRECDLSRSGTTFCGDRACRVHEMQARVRFVPVAGNPLRGSCVENWRLCSITLVRGVSGELEDENWRLCRTTSVRVRTGDFVVQL